MILFVYPVIGTTIRQGILEREKWLVIDPMADTEPVEQAQHRALVVAMKAKTGTEIIVLGLCLSEQST